MSSLTNIIARARHMDVNRLRGLRPHYPPVAVEVDPKTMTLVRLKQKRGKSMLESHQSVEVPDDAVGSSIFRPNLGSADVVRERVEQLFEKSGTKPGKVSLVLPDNLAKVSLVSLPELPSSRKQLEELIRFKLRRAVPFRLEDAVLSYQVQGAGAETTVLVAVILRSVVEQYERVFEAAGARPGLVDLCTNNLINLCRPELAAAAAAANDTALLNCAENYFTLVIMRRERLIFYRCKSYPVAAVENPESNGLSREINTSLSYYKEKLGGDRIGLLMVRSVGLPPERMAAVLQNFDFGEVRIVQPASVLELAEGLQLDPLVGQRLAPALGAAASRG